MSPRALTIALVVSLVVNVFVIGAVAGVLLTHGAPPWAKSPPRPNPLMAAAANLDPADRDALRALMIDEVQRQAPTRIDAMMARRQAVALMRAPTFDRAAAGAALDRARADDMAVRQKLENTLLDFAAKLDARSRIALSDGMTRGAARRWMAAHPGGNEQPAAGRQP